MTLRIGFETISSARKHQIGPYIFLNRLAEAMTSYEGVIAGAASWPIYDIALYCNVKKHRLISKPYLLRCGGLYIDKMNEIGDSFKMNKKILSSVDKASGIIFVSKFIGNLFGKFKKNIHCPTTVIGNGVSLEQFSPAGDNFRDRLGIGTEDLVFVVSAQWRRHKRFDDTVEIFHEFNSVYKRKCYLVVLGQTPNTEIRYNNVLFSGHVAPHNLPAWYRTGDIFLQLAWIEPAGNTQIEAMACGLPVICANNGGIGESITACNGGKISCTDPEYGFDMVNYYDPPSPNYDAVIRDIFDVAENLPSFKANIDRSAIDIRYVANQYVEFTKKILRADLTST